MEEDGTDGDPPSVKLEQIAYIYKGRGSRGSRACGPPGPDTHAQLNEFPQTKNVHYLMPDSQQLCSKLCWCDMRKPTGDTHSQDLVTVGIFGYSGGVSIFFPKPTQQYMRYRQKKNQKKKTPRVSTSVAMVFHPI